MKLRPQGTTPTTRLVVNAPTLLALPRLLLLVLVCLVVPPASVVVVVTAQNNCGCPRCVDAVLDALAGRNTCSERINFLRTPDGGELTETAACELVSEQHPDVCGPACHPTKCQDDVPDYCGCFSCTDQELDRVIGDIGGNETCRTKIRDAQRDQKLSEEEACLKVTSDFWVECGAACNPTKCDGKQPALCGCESCTETILQSKAGNFSCLDRIQSVQTTSNLTELEGCQRIADEFPLVCGPDCDPRYVPYTCCIDTCRRPRPSPSTTARLLLTCWIKKGLIWLTLLSPCFRLGTRRLTLLLPVYATVKSLHFVGKLLYLRTNKQAGSL